MYAQIDSRWSGMEIPGSGGVMATEGCYVTAISNILTASGRDTTPAQVLEALVVNGGINQQGLVIHAKVTEAYPELVYGGSGYGIVQGSWKTAHGQFTHFVCQLPDGSYVDSYTGNLGLPSGFSVQFGQSVSVSPVEQPAPQEDPAPASPETPAPEVPAAPVEEAPAAPQEPSYPEVTVAPGDTLGHIIAAHYGLDSWAQIAEKLPAVCQLNGIENANLIHPGQVIRLP